MVKKDQGIKLPCIKYKCILLPICKSKTHIMCNILESFYASESRKLIQKILPKVNYISNNEGSTHHLLFPGFRKTTGTGPR